MEPSCHGSLALVVYNGANDGVLDGEFVDVQVRWFRETDPDEIRERIENEERCGYLNCDGEYVEWILSQALVVEPFSPGDSGEEVVGFITHRETLFPDR